MRLGGVVWPYNIPSSGPMGCYSAAEVLLAASEPWGAASAQVNQGVGLCPLWPHRSSKCGGSAHSMPTVSIFLKKSIMPICQLSVIADGAPTLGQSHSGAGHQALGHFAECTDDPTSLLASGGSDKGRRY